MSIPSANIKDQQRLLGEQFATRAHIDAARLDQLAASLPSNCRTRSLEEMRHLAHRLCGGAGIFGYHEITGPAGLLESLIDLNGSDADIQNNTDALTKTIRDAVHIKATK